MEYKIGEVSSIIVEILLETSWSKNPVTDAEI